MKKLGIALIVIAVIIASLAPLNLVFAADSIKVQFFNGNTTATTNTIYPSFKVVNNGTTTLALSTVKIRYYFTNDGTQSNGFACDYSTIGSTNVTGTFTTISAPNADRYLEISFASGAGSLATGAGVEVKGRLWKSDWSNFTQTNDYSFNSTATNYIDWQNTTGYIGGVMIWGIEPGGSTATNTPTATPSIATVTPTPTPSTATPTPTPSTATPTPTPSTATPTPTPSTATATPTPSATATGTATPTATATATATPTPSTATPTPTPTSTGGTGENNDDWLHVVGNTIVDKDGKAVWLTGANWFGFNTGTNVFDGVWSCNMKQALNEIGNRGFNLLRVPISAELIYQWSQGTYPKPNVNDYVNPELSGKNSLEVFDAAVQDCKDAGIKIMLDIHSAKTDASGHYYPVWYNGTITSEIYYSACEWITNRYKNDDTIIAFDLKNEPHGKAYSETLFAKWDNSTDENNWKHAAETCANRILAVNPNMLIMVEGIETYPKDGKTWTSKVEGDYYGTWWGGNLRPVKDYPIKLGVNQDQLVYSPHDYGPSVFRQAWFYTGFNETTLYNDCWRDNWAYIMDQGIAPLLVGEWGGFLDGGDNQKWMGYLRDYMKRKYIHHTFWCYNANSGDTGGLVSYDFITWDEAKYSFVKPALWQDAAGKFVGLDHVKPLGVNGKNINVTQYYQNGGTPPTP